MPANQEAIQRVILPALKRTFGAYVKNRAVIQKLISGQLSGLSTWMPRLFELCTASFVVYALRSTYSNLSGSSKRKTKKDDHLSRSRAYHRLAGLTII